MARDDTKFRSAKAAYKQAVANGNRQEEARWANVIGDILKCRGEYVEALRWLRIDYEVSTKYLPEKHLLPTCQSVGEVYLRLQQYREALYYQKKHLELAKENNDLVEQQRACTQLGRTYYEMFSRSENDHYSKRSAKKYFKMALEIARNLRTKPQQKSCFFVKEYIDAQNNLGMLEMDLDNFDEAERILLEGLQICDDEEVAEFDDARSRLHNNLGSVYIELRAWNKAKEHIEKDIIICKKICHLQGEAKGYINLGELHYRVQKYEEAQLCYRKALDIAKSLEDEDALVDQINQNIETVKEASKVLHDIKVEEQRLKKLARKTVIAKGKPNERRCLLDQCASLDLLIDKSSIIFMWPNHREFAKRKKRVATELCDKEKLSDSFLAIGESYQKLRNFSKARKWYMKSWNMFRSIGNLEGQALAKINIGAVLDSAGDWAGALQSFEDGYRMASEGKLLSVQISALDNMHYSNMIRFDNMEEARKLQQEINKLKCSLNEEDEPGNESTQCCSETESDRGHLSDCASDSCNSHSFSTRLEIDPVGIESDDNAPLSTLVPSGKAKKKLTQLASIGKSIIDPGHTKKDSSKDNCSPHQVGRKRVRVVLSDDELADDDESGLSAKKLPNSSFDDLITSGKGREGGKRNNPKTNNAALEDLEKEGTSCSPTNFDESTCSFKSESPKSTALNSKVIGSISLQELPVTSPSGASEFKTDGLQAYSTLEGEKDAFCPQISTDSVEEHLIPCKIAEEMIFTDISCCATDDTLDTEAFKIQIACLYYLQLCDEKRSKGLLPIIQHLKCGGKILGASEPLDEIKDYISQKECVHVVLDGWVHNRLIKLYIDQCKKLSESPNIKLVKKLYNLEVSEDEVVISDCDLQDMSISPFLEALHEHKTISSLDVSHNLLGNGTLEKLQQILASSSQKYGGLALDLHCNRFGPTALFQICECNVLFTRLEVLNLSDNRLTDACGSYLSTILQNCRALHSLKIENCSITSRTVQRMADSLDPGSLLSELYLGRNNPISGTAMINLLTKLGSLRRISELSLDAVKLSKPVADALCLLAKSSNLSCLMLGATNIGAEGSGQLVDALSSSSQELVKLDLSRCSLHFQTLAKICDSDGLLANLLDLNFSGNVLGLEGSKAVISLLKNPVSSLRVLILDKCFIGLCGIIQIIQALAGNEVLEELNLAENVTGSHGGNLQGQSKMNSKTTGGLDHSSREAKTAQQESSSTTLNLGCERRCERQEVADSEDNPSGSSKPNPSELDDCASSGERRPSTDYQFFHEELSKAIEKATFLQSLDLSRNGFSAEAAQSLFQAWRTSKNLGSAEKHIKDNITHFSVGGKKCCGIKTCCQRY